MYRVYSHHRFASTARDVDSFCDALALDEERLNHHTLLLIRAKHWHEQGRGTTGLLDAEATKAYVAWLESAERFTEPRATDLQRTYIETSRIWNAARRRRARAGASGQVCTGRGRPSRADRVRCSGR